MHLRNRLAHAAMLCLVLQCPAWAHDPSAAASHASAVPLALSVAAPVGLLSAGAALTVVGVQASANGTVWLLERVSDGARMSVTVAGQTSAAVGGAVTVVALGTGWILSQAGRALCFIPNETGAALLHNELVAR